MNDDIEVAITSNATDGLGVRLSLQNPITRTRTAVSLTNDDARELAQTLVDIADLNERRMAST